MRRLILLAILFGACSASAGAQTVRGDRIVLNTGPCVERSGNGTPEGAVTGNPCDTWQRTDTGQIYKKVTGSGTNTGWMPVVGGTGATCSAYPGCAAAQVTWDTTLFDQRLRTDHNYVLRQYVGTEDTVTSGHLSAFNASGWMPLKIAGGPTQVVGGGLHVGQTITADPGVGNTDLDGYIGQPGYVSQTTGWRITNDGAGDFRYLYTDELHAKAFIADLEQALAGGQIISKSVAQVGAVFTVPAPGSVSTLIVKDLPSAADMAVFQTRDFVRVRQFSRAAGSLSITDAWGTVAGYADLADGLQSWQFTRAIADAGAMTTGTQIAVDALVLDYGVSGNGFYEVNAIDGAYGVHSPYAQVVTWSGDSPAAANQTLRARFGNLKGVTGTAEYGLLAGTYAATNGRYFLASDQHFELHGIDLKLWNGTTNVIRLDHLTPYWSMGNPAPTSYTSGNGCWSGLDAGVFKWRCGDIAGGAQFISWNGTQLTVAGNIIITGTSIDAATVTGVAGATVVSGAARGLLGIDSNGNPLLPHTATPSGSGLFLGSDYLGYFTGGAWKTFMDASGNFYLGGTGGALQWNAGAGTLTIAATLSGNGSSITSIDGGHITAGTVTTSALNFTPATSTNVVATINASAEGIQISGARIAINGSTTFSAGYDPTSKIVAGGAAADVNANATTISGGKITASSITAAQVTAGTFVSVGGAAGDVNAGATTISGGKITTASITSTQIAANTILAEDIAAGTITADRLNVSTLSAITANLGTVSAGSISGVTMTAGGSGGDVTINASGITISNGELTANKLKWDDGGAIWSTGDHMRLWSDLEIMFIANAQIAMLMYGSKLIPYADPYDLGASGAAFRRLYLDTGGGITINGTAGAGVTLTCPAGQYVKNLTVYGGVVTAASCGS